MRAAPAPRNRQRQQVAHQVGDVLEVVVEADALGRIGADLRAIVLAQSDRSADAGVEAAYFDSGAVTTPSPMLASTRACGSPSAAVVPIGPT